ncbi:MAG TPA: hypothetical protein VNE63_20655 [Candidatus Acidoferrales bacterium]|nr:hypothetical protein [Candidatus Acidoferrales bacterium]
MLPVPSDNEGRSSTVDHASPVPDLLVAIDVVRRRTLINKFLRDWMVWLSWVLAGLLVAAALIPRLKAVLVIGAVAVVLGAFIAIARIWWTKPSAYALACKLDSAAGLFDRTSTALHLAAVENPNWMALRQRQDALERLARVDTPALFPVQIPAFARRTLALILLAAGFFVYRVYYRPPITALVHTAVNSRAAKAVLSPLAESMKRDLLALVSRDNAAKQVSADAEVVPGLKEARDSGNLAQPGDNAGGVPNSDWEPDATQPGQPVRQPSNLQPGQSSPQAQEGNKSDSNQQEAEASQQSQTVQSTERGSSEQQASNSSQQANNEQSGAKSVIQVLKNLIKSIRGQQSPQSPPPAEWAPGDQPPTAQASADTGNAHEHTAQGDTSKGDSDRRDSSAISDPKKPGGGAGNGSTAIPRQGVKNPPPVPANLVRDRVDLDATDFRQPGHLRASAGPGTALLPLRDVQPQSVAAIKGAEQENIPVRYRLYVQRYFEREDKTPVKLSSQPPGDPVKETK